MQRNFFNGNILAESKTRLTSIYFGGGTPSILSGDEIIRIFKAIGEYFLFDSDTEITLEANPDDLSMEKMSLLRQTPVNRLSIGIQSFHHADLKYMNRAHSPAQAYRAVENAYRAGYSNLNIDLIYGTPTMTDTGWKTNLHALAAMDVAHVSAYALTVEPGTALQLMIRRGTAAAVDEDRCARQFSILTRFMKRHGYEHYETSNFAIPGYFSRHNLAYWQGSPYLGIGPSAHSYLPGQRWWNASNTTLWTKSLLNNQIPSETEILSRAQQCNEYVMTSLRTMWGCSLGLLGSKWGEDFRSNIMHQAGPYIEKDMLYCKDNTLKTTEKGKLFADRIASDLFQD